MQERAEASVYFSRVENPEKRRQLGKMFRELPDCFKFMQAAILDFTLGEEITVAVPVLNGYCNPALSMQGGFIGAAFDNAFGPLCFMASGTHKSAMLDMSTSFHRPVLPGEELTICVRVKAKGRRKVHMVGDAFNGKRKLIATAVATYMILE